jgi:hypothetical protein
MRSGADPSKPASASTGAQDTIGRKDEDAGVRSGAAQVLQGGRGEEGCAVGFLEASLRAQGTSLEGELAKIGGVTQVCALRGLVSVLPKAVLCTPLALANRPDQAQPAAPPAGFSAGCSAQHSPPSITSSALQAAAAPSTSAAFQHHEQLDRQLREQDAVDGSEQQHREPGDAAQRARPQAHWCMLMDGALPTACQAIAAAPDAHFKLHAVSLLAQSLLRCKDCLEVRHTKGSFPPLMNLPLRSTTQVCATGKDRKRDTCGRQHAWPALACACRRTAEALCAVGCQSMYLPAHSQDLVRC